MSLYKLTQEQELIQWELEESGGELTPELEARLDLTRESLPVKVESRVRWIRSNDASIDALGVEIAKLQARLKSGLRDTMNVFGMKQLVLTITRLSLCRIAKRGIKPLLPIEQLPTELRKTKEVFDSDAARKIFEEKGIVPGCEIGPEYSIRGL